MSLVIVVVLLAVLVPLGFATDDGGEDGAASLPVATIAERVETLRGLRFKTKPDPVTVTKAQATKEGLADLDRNYPAARRQADEELYALLGLLPEDTDLRELSGSIFGDQVAGYYDPRTKDLRIVEGAATNRVIDEMIVAHELVHALEDQQGGGLDTESISDSDDPAYAYKALVEGTATRVMYAYVGRYFKGDVALGGLLATGISAPSTANLPPFLVDGLTFPYLRGNEFVGALYEQAGSWRLVDLALGERPPVSTEQILHPRKWLTAEQPIEVDVPDPGDGWEELTSGVFGEWQTERLLALGGRVQREAAAGWGGDRYRLFARGAERRLVIRWTFDTPRDEAEFAPALRTYVEEGVPDGVEATVDGTTLTLSRA